MFYIFVAVLFLSLMLQFFVTIFMSLIKVNSDIFLSLMIPLFVTSLSSLILSNQGQFLCHYFILLVTNYLSLTKIPIPIIIFFVIVCFLIFGLPTNHSIIQIH